MVDLYALPAELPGWPLHLIKERFNPSYHGDFERWRNAAESLPKTNTEHRVYDDTVSAGMACDQETLGALTAAWADAGGHCPS